MTAKNPAEIAGYVVIVSMAGYLPESDPILCRVDHERAPIIEALEVIADEVSRFADQAAYAADAPELSQWEEVVSEIENDRDHDAELDPCAGLYYLLPDGYAIEASAYTAPELAALGYTEED